MAWPDNTTLIDNFNRASIGTNWHTGSWYGDNALAIYNNSNLTSSATWGGGYYNVTTYGPDINLIFDVVDAWSDISLFGRLNSSDSPSGYVFKWNVAVGGKIERIDGGVDTQLGALFAISLSAGDKIGLEIIGNAISVYRYTGGAWSLVATRTDDSNTYPDAGYLGAEVRNANEDLIDNMSGGTVSGGANYSRGNYASLPSDDADLETIYSAPDVTDVSSDNGIRVSQLATGEYAIHQYKDNVGNRMSATLYWDGQTDFSPRSSTVYLQIYNRNSTSWQTVDSENNVDANTDFVLTADISNLANYKDGSNIICCRIYQQAV